MSTFAKRLFTSGLLLAFVAAITIGVGTSARAAVIHYQADLDGPSESPPVASTGFGFAQVVVDDVAHTMRVSAFFTGLVGTTTASHIHGPTAVAGAGTASVATTTPSFVGFPLSVTAGTFDNTLDLTLAGSYRAGFITSNGGTVAGAEAALLLALAQGKAYFNIHSSFAPGGEIRGFLQAFDPTPTRSSTWGRVKSLYK